MRTVGNGTLVVEGRIDPPDRLEDVVDAADVQKRLLLASERGFGQILRCGRGAHRSEEHTSELQSQSNLVCRLLLEKKKIDWTFIPARGMPASLHVVNDFQHPRQSRCCPPV